jgi:hypothetical protein
VCAWLGRVWGEEGGGVVAVVAANWGGAPRAINPVAVCACIVPPTPLGVMGFSFLWVSLHIPLFARASHVHVPRRAVPLDRYHLFGDTTNYAMLMESNGVPDAVHISEEAYILLSSRQEQRLAVRCCLGGAM